MSFMAENIPSLECLVEEAKRHYAAQFDDETGSLVCGVAPGRVNLIGEHTDYNQGLVLPIALNLFTVVVGKKASTIADTDEWNCRISTTSKDCDDPKMIAFHPRKLEKGLPRWSNYVKGVIANFHDKFALPTEGFNACIVSSVPLGGGVSSSASLEVAFYTFLEALTESKAPSGLVKALACQKAEHDFAGVPCGIMDQFVSVMAQQGCALKIDCQQKTVEHVPCTNNLSEVTFVLANSNIKHELCNSEYSSRRAQCEEAAALLQVKSLREVHLEKITRNVLYDEKIFKRAHHVVSEIRRTEKAAIALAVQDYTTFGRLMVQSHESLRDDYEVSSPELDQLVKLALSVDGVFGSRMTGGGFGGCIITLVEKIHLRNLLETLSMGYQGQATFYDCGTPGFGSRILKL